MLGRRYKLATAAALSLTLATSALATSELAEKSLPDAGNSSAVHFDALADSPNNLALIQLLEKADQLALHQNDHWLQLLHFEPQLFGKQRCLIDGPHFFLSEQGKTDARAELRATLTGFFSQQPLPPRGNSAQCKYVARYHWLDQQLNFNAAGLSAQHCPNYERYVKALNPAGITLIFASSHSGSPASMFGHTLLRIDKPQQTDATKMLAWSLNYAANVGPNPSPISYIAGGVAGGYPGRFTVLPYYLKMREYGQMEDRTIWEYKLSLSQQQIETIARHSYEMSSTWSDYFFFSENCSYFLLRLLDVALPGPRVSRGLHHWVAPADTVVALREAGLIESVVRSPGYSDQIRARRKGMSADDQQLALALSIDSKAPASTKLNSLPTARKIQVLDLAYDFRRYRRIREIGQLDVSLNREEGQLLAQRAALGGRSEKPVVPPTTRPDFGHGSRRVSTGIGEGSGFRFAALGWRAAYHDLLDPQAGYRKNSRLNLLDVQARLYHQNEARNTLALKLHQLNLFDVITLEPSDPTFNRLSWNARFGLRSTFINDQSRSVTTLAGGLGKTWKLAENNGWVSYAMLDADLDYANFLHGNYRLAADPRLGVVGQIAANSRLHIEGRQRWKFAGHNDNDWSIGFGFSQQLTPELSLKLELSRYLQFSERSNQLLLSMQHYY